MAHVPGARVRLSWPAATTAVSADRPQLRSRRAGHLSRSWAQVHLRERHLRVCSALPRNLRAARPAELRERSPRLAGNGCLGPSRRRCPNWRNAWTRERARRRPQEQVARWPAFARLLGFENWEASPKPARRARAPVAPPRPRLRCVDRGAGSEPAFEGSCFHSRAERTGAAQLAPARRRKTARCSGEMAAARWPRGRCSAGPDLAVDWWRAHRCSAEPPVEPRPAPPPASSAQTGLAESWAQ